MRAKTKLTRLCGILLTLALLVGLLPTVALAADPAADFTDGDGTAALALLNTAKTDGAANSEWNNITKTLTLNGVNFTTSAAIAVKLPANTTIVLAGGTTNTIKGGDSNSSSCLGIYVETGNLTIQGPGTLNVTGGAANSSYGIYVPNGNVTINGGTVTATGGATSGTNGESCGILSSSVSITGGTVTATGGEATNKSYGIFANAGNVSITGGTVTATGGEASGTNGGSYGICANAGSVSISSTADVTATGGEVSDTDCDSYGICANAGSVSIFGTADVTATGGAATYDSYGIHAGIEVTIENDAEVTATSGRAQGLSCGIHASTVDISGGTVTATGGTTPVLSCGIFAPSNATISGPARVTATSGAAASGTSGSIMSVNKSIGGHTITFHANGGGGIGEMQAFTGSTGGSTGIDYTLPANGFTPPDGKQFTGWATSADGEGIPPGTSITVKDNDTRLYAIWTERSYPVTLNTNGATSCDALTTYTFGAGATLPTPTKTGYTFGGWYDNSSFTGEAVTVIAADATGAKTFYAKWNAISSGGSYTPPTYKVESTVSKDDDGTVSVSKSNARKGDTVTITVTPNRYYKVDGVTVKDALGNQIAVTDNGDGTFTFQMPASKVTVEPVFSWDNPFTDVAGDAYYAPAVEWALKNDVTNGTSATTFSPNAGCTRAQIVTFLWRAAGCPEPAGMSSFTDVSADAYYAKAVAWAAEQGITDGTGDGKFSPDAVCTRSQSMTFIYRSEQAQGGGMQGEWMFQNPFTDVNLEDYYGEAVMWAVANGVTSGTSDTTFSPNATCTRGQVVTFLYRFFVK